MVLPVVTADGGEANTGTLGNHPSDSWPNCQQDLQAFRLVLLRQSAVSLTGHFAQGRALRLDCPFGDLLWPLVVLAIHHQSVDLTGCEFYAGRVRCYGIEIPHMASQTLTRRVASMLARTLYHEYSQFRGPGKTMVAMLLNDETQDHAVYEEFCRHVLANNYQTLLADYPVALRLVFSETRLWLRSLSRFALRFHNDGADIQAALGLSALPKLHAIEMYVSDPHSGGKSAMQIHLIGGDMLIYKERPPNADQLYDDFIDFFHSLAGRPCLRKVRKLLRDHHQWCEYVHHRPTSRPEMVSDFYFSMGVLICIAYVLRISDVHYENLIAEHGLPVLVDVETIGGTCIATNKKTASLKLEGTVLDTGIIPMETIDSSGITSDFSGLSSTRKRMRFVTKWRGLGTDHLAPRKVHTSSNGHNLPSELQLQLPVDQCESLCVGFDFAYRLLQQHQSTVCYFLDAFEGKVESRILWNATQGYYDLLEAMMAPENLVSEAQWRDHMRQLLSKRGQLTSQVRPGTIEDEEFRQLNCLDIPYFTLASLEGTLWPSHSLRAVAQQLSDHDRALQISLIKESLKAAK